MKPPKVLYVNPCGTSTESGAGFIGFASEQVCAKDISHDRDAGMKASDELWVYELKQVNRIKVTTEKRK